MKQRKTFRILEILWLVIGAVGIASFVYTIIAGQRDQAIYFLVFTIVAGVMFAVRRLQRKRAEENDRNNNTIS